jgi:cob(I)alamin adenosyltransferase
VAQRLSPELVIKPMGRDGFVDPDNPSPEDIALAQGALKEAQKILDQKECDLLILDEVNVAVSLKLVEEDAVLKLMNDKPGNVELILTGRGAPASFIEKAHLVTNMESTKHYFDQGVAAREGIEK